MRINLSTYQNITITKWVFLITILFGFGGYTNYTQPRIKEVTTELIVDAVKETQNIVCFGHILQKERNSSFICNKNTSTKELSLKHAELTINGFKKYSAFISLFQKQKIITSLQITSEEDSFHYTLG